MSQLIQTHIEAGEARIVDAPTHAPEIDRSFNLPTGLFRTTVACYLAFIGVMALGFGNPVLVIPMVIFVGFIIAGFGVPAVFTRLKGNTSEPLTSDQFKREGIATNTGRLASRDATAQVLILPVLLVCWGIAAAVIAAVVS